MNWYVLRNSIVTPVANTVIPTGVMLDSAGSYSYAFWLQISADPVEIWTTLFHKGNVDAERNPGVWILTQGAAGSRTQQVYISTGTNDTANFGHYTPLLSLSTWNHIAFTFTGTTKTLYVNGVVTLTVQSTATLIDNNGATFYCGDPWYPAANTTYISDLRFSAQAASAAEIAALATFGVPIFYNYVSRPRAVGDAARSTVRPRACSARRHSARKFSLQTHSPTT